MAGVVEPWGDARGYRWERRRPVSVAGQGRTGTPTVRLPPVPPPVLQPVGVGQDGAALIHRELDDLAEGRSRATLAQTVSILRRHCLARYELGGRACETSMSRSIWASAGDSRR